MSGGRRNGTHHGAAAITITIAIDINVRRLGGVATSILLLSRVGGSGSIARRLSIRCGAFSLRRLLVGGGSFNNGRLLLREGADQILFKDNFEIFNPLKLVKLQSTPAGSDHSRLEGTRDKKNNKGN